MDLNGAKELTFQMYIFNYSLKLARGYHYNILCSNYDVRYSSSYAVRYCCCCWLVIVFGEASSVFVSAVLFSTSSADIFAANQSISYQHN